MPQSFYQNDGCGKEVSAVGNREIIALFVQFSVLIGLSHLLHSILRRFGQPSPISQLLAGLVMGPTLLLQNRPLAQFLYPGSMNRDFFSTAATLGRQIFMFLIGLEIDIPYLFRSSKTASILAAGGAAGSALVALIVSPVIFHLLGVGTDLVSFAPILMLIFANTASPILVRMTSELKLTTSEVGRLAISAALINDMVSLILIAVVTSVFIGDGGNPVQLLLRAIFAVISLSFGIYLIRPVVRFLNRRNRHRRNIRFFELVFLLFYVFAVSSLTEMIGYNSMMSSFLLGLLFPREGSTARTVLFKLTYPVHNFILPIYFGYTGVQTDMSYVKGPFFWAMLLVVITSTASKVAGTLIASSYLKVPFYEGLALGFLLNVKGHVDLIIILMVWGRDLLTTNAASAMITTVMLNTLITGPAVALVVRRERRAMNFMSKGLEWTAPESELRMLACVHGTRDIPSTLTLIELSSGSEKAAITAYVMQLVELTAKTAAPTLYHQHEDEEEEDDEGADQARQINSAVDAFTQETNITLRQVTAVSSFANMHEDVCHGAEDIRASIVVLPFHKFKRIDGKMVTKKEGLRTVNGKTLTRAPCTVAIFVDRDLGVSGRSAQEGYEVAVLFFGGPDDREALALGGRLALNPLVSLTVVRFLPESRASFEAEVEMQAARGEEVLMAINHHEKETEADEAFISNFYTRFVVSGMVSFVEKKVSNSLETLDALRTMNGQYALFLVGRGSRRLSPFVVGLNDWEECPELGPIGDLLASSDFTVHGSVLVLQQNSHSKKKGEEEDDEFNIF